MNKLFNKLINQTFEEYKQGLTDTIVKNGKKFIITANTETFTIAMEDEEFLKILLDKNIELISDGIGLVKMSKYYGNKLKERIPGIDLIGHLLNECNKLNKSVYFYGAKENVINKMIPIVKNKYPNLQILGYKNGYSYNRDEIFLEIEQLNPDLCLVALGIPDQEKLIYKHINKFKRGIFIGVGGTFDILSGEKKRAPKIFLKFNLEWLYRITTEPKRIKRFYKYNIEFLKKNLKYRKER